MSSTQEIPRATAPNASIAVMEHALQRARDVLAAVSVVDRFMAADVHFKAVRMSDTYVSGECCYDFQLFFRSASTPCFHIQSEDRLEWGKQLPAVLKALEGLPVRVSQDNVWRWDDRQPRANGGSTYVPIYRITIFPGTAQAQPFEAEPLLTSMTAKHCMAEHPLADQQLFHWQESLLGKTLFQSYFWTPTGFMATFYTKRDCTEACESLFKEFDHLVIKEGKGPTATWRVQVNLTKVLSEVS